MSALLITTAGLPVREGRMGCHHAGRNDAESRKMSRLFSAGVERGDGQRLVGVVGQRGHKRN